ncbi:hypothetical protein DK847_13550 [Aestuariivirga litoralis]|uniref:Uncharacterized protein n=1 Tax=Aestuariivirga litoralis TaxID=2650924 RepID=A0A2W2B7C6_9HYPH|nr:hypothetical protein DK847_13550 [Aestuariivirga litoralis]
MTRSRSAPGSTSTSKPCAGRTKGRSKLRPFSFGAQAPKRTDPGSSRCPGSSPEVSEDYFFAAFLAAFLAGFLAAFLAAGFLAAFLAAFLAGFFAAFFAAIAVSPRVVSAPQRR